MKVFCVGLFRTGTTTMCEMFARSFRADHEFQVEEEIDILQRRIAGAIDADELKAFVRDRDVAKPLDLDSCGAHFGVLDVLVDEFPEAKFILTMRSVYSWMNSCVGKLYGDFIGGWGSRAGSFMNCLTFLPDGSFALEDHSGSKICLEQMMKAWNSLNRRIERMIPADRLLVVNTEVLSDSVEPIASFCGVDSGLLDPVHSNPGQTGNFLACFDARRLENLVDLNCGELMARRYPALTLRSWAESARSEPAPDCADLLQYFSLDEFVETKFVQTFVPVRE